MKYWLTALALTFILSPLAQAEIKTEVIEYRDGPAVLQGYLAYDDAIQNVRPGVLVAPEWWGLNDYAKHRAVMLARMGYVAFAIDMYGKDNVTTDPQQAGKWATPFHTDRALCRQRAGAGLDVLLKNKLVDKQQIAGIGYCFGGMCVLELARAGAPLKGVIAFHGDLSRDANEPADNIKGKILICHGAEDPMVKLEAVHTFIEEMKEAKANYQINIYSGALHAFTNPGASEFHLPGIGYNEQADKRSWMALNDFFAELFRVPATTMPADGRM